MKTVNHQFASIVLATLFGLGASESQASLPPGYYGPPPGYYSPPAEIIIAPRPPPPPLREEIIIAAPSPAHAWIPGYWGWRNRWQWIPGRWALPPRPGMRWYGYEWVPHDDGMRWRMRAGGWR